MKIGAMAWQTTVFSIAVISGLFSAHATASSVLKICTERGLCGEAETVTDAQLADVAGKFTVAGDVVGMQLIMLSSWQAANGQKLEGAATVAIGLPGDGRPGHISTQANATGTSAPELAGPANRYNTVTGSAALANMNGMSQVIQVAGNGNDASNRAAIEVTSANLIVPTGGNSSSAAEYKATDGSLAQVDIANNSVSIQLKMPNGSGTAQQNANVANNGSIHQAIQIAASNQYAVNQMLLQIQVRPTTNFGLAEQGLSHALSTLLSR